ncbi:LOW QUALITY PROTEIN: SUN domain-containing protein 3-like [Cariama cristata]
MGKGEGGVPGSSPAVLPSLAAAGTSPGRLPAADLWSICMEVEMTTRFLQSTPSSATQGPAKWCERATDIAKTARSLALQWAGALASLGTHLLMSICYMSIFTMYVLPVAAVDVGRKGMSEGQCKQKGEEGMFPSQQDALFFRQTMALQKKRFLKVIILLPVALAADECVCCRTQDPEEVQEVKQAVSDIASEVYVEMSDWALKTSGATIDMQRTSKTYNCKEEWICSLLWFFRTANPSDTILQPDVSPGNCWALQGHQGQVVIRLPARVHLTAVTVEHISKEVSPSGTIISTPSDVAVFCPGGILQGLLGTVTYDMAKEAIRSFPLKNVPLPRAFSCIKLLVKSNWGNPVYSCIYVQVHGKTAKPESLN